MTLVDELNAQGVLAVLAAAGIELEGQAFGPCPRCGAGRRGSRDPRPPARVFSHERETAWACFACRGGGDAAALAAALATGESLTRHTAAAVRSWASSRGLVAGEGAPCTTPPRPRPAPRQLELPPPQRPPRLELEQLLAQAVPVIADAEVAAWLAGRGLNPGDVEDRSLAFALPRTAELPSWAACSGTWIDSGHRLLLPLYDECGDLASVRARCVRAQAFPAKALSPRGLSVAGLVLADPLARLMLAGAELADGSPAAELVREAGLLLAEGEPDFLILATRASDAAELAPAVLGVVAGSWTPAIAERIPSGTKVAAWTDSDATGDRYAEKVAETLAGRCDVRRGVFASNGGRA